MSNVHIVDPQWLIDCASEWRRLDETKYYIKEASKQNGVFEETKDDKPLEETNACAEATSDLSSIKMLETCDTMQEKVSNASRKKLERPKIIPVC